MENTSQPTGLTVVFSLARTIESPLQLLPELKQRVRSRFKACPVRSLLSTWKQAELIVRSRASEQEGLGQILNWITNVVAKPHTDLGRQGSVCPFLPRALKAESLFFHELHIDGNTSNDEIDEMIQEYADVFVNTAPASGKARLNKAIVLIFPNLADEDAIQLIEETQRRLKPFFVGRGLMLGEFHKNHQGEGIRNPLFRPLQSPVPLLVIRHLIPSDLLFLVRKSDSASRRVHFLQSFLSIHDGALPAQTEQDAHQALAEALEELSEQTVRLTL